jgi:hypothetical protein
MQDVGVEKMTTPAMQGFDLECLAEKLMQPRGNWRLLEDTVFQFNDIYRQLLRSVCDSSNPTAQRGMDEIWMLPAMFDKQSRTFNWIALADTLLSSEGNDYDKIDKIVDSICDLHRFFNDEENAASRESFESLFDNSPHCAEAINIILKEIHFFTESLLKDEYRNEIIEDKYRLEDLIYAFSSIYSSYSHPRQHSLEGCFYIALEKFGKSEKFQHIVNDAIFGYLDNDLIALDCWMRERRIDDNIWKKLSPWNGKESETIQKPRIINNKEYYYRPLRLDISKQISDVLLNTAMSEWPISIAGREVRVAEYLKTHNYLLLVPIYDVWIGPVGFGCLHAVLVFFLEPPSPEEAHGVIGHARWEDVYRDKILPKGESFAERLSAISIRRALATPVSPPYDLLSHFLKILAEVQDWEEAVVYRAGTPCYRFRRNSEPAPEPGGSERYLRVRIPWEMDEEFDSGSEFRGPSEPTGGLSQDTDGNAFMWWTCERTQPDDGSRPGFDLWSDYFLPELTEKERATFQDTSIRFKFPKACRLPPQNQPQARNFLVETYQRQQLELMRALIPKVRARRAALRNAVSAIMGRNMSHNIGSHVLARYASHKVEMDHIDPQYLDPRADFLSYLQRRMDFLAEVSTTDMAYWSQPLSLKQQLARLDYEQQMGVFGNNAGRFPPLLEFITGKDNLKATVSFSCVDVSRHLLAEGDPGDLMFSCPGGEVGVHALYVILENIIRNSARHNGENATQVRVNVVAEHCPEADLIALRIIDTRSLLREDGARKGSETPDGPVWSPRSRAELAQIWAGLSDEQKRKHAFHALPDRINWIIQHEPFLDTDGAPRPEYWGLREIQICAQYLRQISLSDLENRFHLGDSDTTRQVLKDYPVLQAEAYPFAEGEYCLSYLLYLPKAKLCATISAGDEAVLGWQPGKISGFADLKLPAELIDGSGNAGGEKDKRALEVFLRNLSGYGFVVYDDGDESVAKWVDRHKHCLPIRCLKQSNVDAEVAGGSADAASLLEPMHKAYAEMRADLQEGRHLAGVAIAYDQLTRARQVLGGKKPEDWASPLACITKNFIRGWLNKEGLEAAFWIDHVGQEHLKTMFNALSAHNRYAQENSPELNAGFIGWEACFSGLPASNAIEALEPGQGWELLASAVPRIAVLDERVQAQAGNEFRSIELRRYWEGMRVQVPECDACNLDRPTMESCRDWLDGLTDKQDFLIVHLTILERLCDEMKLPDAAAVVGELIADNKQFEDCIVAVVTGRGVATFGRSVAQGEEKAVGEALRYLPVSAFLEYLVRRPSKLGLMRTLWSASRPKAA